MSLFTPPPPSAAGNGAFETAELFVDPGAGRLSRSGADGASSPVAAENSLPTKIGTGTEAKSDQA